MPITLPTWRVVLNMPDAAPAIRGLMSRMATVVIGANVQPMPMPATSCGAKKSYQAEVGCAMSASQPMPTEKQASPVIRMYLPPMRSDSRPATGAMNIAMTEAGASVRPALRAEKPSTD